MTGRMRVVVMGTLACALAFSVLCPAGSGAIDAPEVSWLQPPPVLPLPPHGGPEGPPRPAGPEPPVGGPAPTTPPRWRRAQDRALVRGPFPANGLSRGISDGLVLSKDSTVRSLTMSRARAAGASVIRIPVDWRGSVAPIAPFAQRDPASRAYRFTSTDAAVRHAVAAGLEPLLVVSRAPSFAEAPHRWRFADPGTWAPDPNALGAFASVLARRYDGSFPDPLTAGKALPRVRLFQAWNEPNLARYLEPQWIAVNDRWQAFSPLLYRHMLNAFYAGVKSVDRTDIVIAAGVAPVGDPDGSGRMAPLHFLWSLLCLPPSVRAHPLNCDGPAYFDVLAFHPLSIQNPDKPAASSLDVSIADAAKVTGALRLAEHAATVQPRAPKQVWVTELNWESAPQSARGVPVRLQGPWISRALHRLWVAGVTLVDWEFLVDPYPSLTVHLGNGGVLKIARPAGLYSSGPSGLLGAKPKAFLQGFRLPFDPLRLDRRRVRIWALLGSPGRVILQRRHGHTWQTIARLATDRWGVINQPVVIRGAARLRLLDGAISSAISRVGAGRARSAPRR